MNLTDQSFLQTSISRYVYFYRAGSKKLARVAFVRHYGKASPHLTQRIGFSMDLSSIRVLRRSDTQLHRLWSLSVAHHLSACSFAL